MADTVASVARGDPSFGQPCEAQAFFQGIEDFLSSDGKVLAQIGKIYAWLDRPNDVARDARFGEPPHVGECRRLEAEGQ